MEDLLIRRRQKVPKGIASFKNFEMEDYKICYKSGMKRTTFTVTEHPSVKFIDSPQLAKNKRQIKLGKFIETTIESIFSSGGLAVSAEQIETGEEHFALLSESGFSVKKFNGKILSSAEGDSAIFGFNCKAEGSINEEKTSLNFELILPGDVGDTIFITGTAIGRKTNC